MSVLMIRADDSILQEIMTFLLEREHCHVIDLPVVASVDVLSFPGMEIYLKEQTVYLNHTLIQMSHYEFFTLSYLAQHPGWVFSKEQIYEAVWKEPGECCGSAVTNVISQIRKKLDGREYIKTVINSGYKFEA